MKPLNLSRGITLSLNKNKKRLKFFIIRQMFFYFLHDVSYHASLQLPILCPLLCPQVRFCHPFCTRSFHRLLTVFPSCLPKFKKCQILQALFSHFLKFQLLLSDSKYSFLPTVFPVKLPCYSHGPFMYS